jgi:hypothetical protein
MNGRDVPSSEAGADEPIPDWDDLLDGRRLPETEDEMRVSDLVAALQAPGTQEELHGASAAVAALIAEQQAAPAPTAVVLPLAPRRRTRTALVAGSVVALTIAFAGTAAAAANGSLPAPLQRVAASLVGAPAPQDEGQDQPSGTPASGLGRSSATPGSRPTGSHPSTGPTQPAGPIASTVRPTSPPGGCSP